MVYYSKNTTLKVEEYVEFDIQQICEDFYSEYAFKIPAMPMTEILNRMVKMGTLTKNRKGKIIPNYDKSPIPSWDIRQKI